MWNKDMHYEYVLMKFWSFCHAIPFPKSSPLWSNELRFDEIMLTRKKNLLG